MQLFAAALLLLQALTAAAQEGAVDSEGTCPAGGCNAVQSIELPRVIIGCWQLLERHADQKKAVETLTAYAHAGFTAFDTADIYGPSESILGKFRKQWVSEQPAAHPLRFFTKYVTEDNGQAEANRINRQSLKAMGIDALDMVQFHHWALSKDGSSKSYLGAGRALTQLKGDGKIKHLAGCNMDTANLKSLVDDGMAIEANQVQFSLLDRRAEVSMLPYCKQHNIKLTAFGVVAGGLLSDSLLGKSAQEARGMLDSVSRRMYHSSLQRWGDWELFQELLKTLKAIGDRHAPQLPIAVVASQWALQRMEQLGAGGALILGVRDARHIEEHSLLLYGSVTLHNLDMEGIQTVLDKGAAPRGDIWYEERGWA